ncbi:hypothetical protein DPMN_075217 [Dreissena polymorpha]|uniref:Uncharacterized protein n=1 Tax=Dreissena polymorpha TaxID=45954 RepID=A0A9D3YGM8_DREPO|nr:hypothetical protein DPMN_075217 [Dreissena polymorpha]
MIRSISEVKLLGEVVFVFRGDYCGYTPPKKGYTPPKKGETSQGWEPFLTHHSLQMM